MVAFVQHGSCAAGCSSSREGADDEGGDDACVCSALLLHHDEFQPKIAVAQKWYFLMDPLLANRPTRGCALCPLHFHGFRSGPALLTQAVCTVLASTKHW